MASASSTVNSATTLAATPANTVVITLPAGDFICQGAEILIGINSNVTNPATLGNYTVTVATSKETNAVTSSAFAVTNPKVQVLPGITTVVNSGGVELNQYNNLATALANVPDKGTIKLSAGTYTDNLSAGNALNITIQGTDPAQPMLSFSLLLLGL